MHEIVGILRRDIPPSQTDVAAWKQANSQSPVSVNIGAAMERASIARVVGHIGRGVARISMVCLTQTVTLFKGKPSAGPTPATPQPLDSEPALSPAPATLKKANSGGHHSMFAAAAPSASNGSDGSKGGNKRSSSGAESSAVKHEQQGGPTTKSKKKMKVGFSNPKLEGRSHTGCGIMNVTAFNKLRKYYEEVRELLDIAGTHDPNNQYTSMFDKTPERIQTAMIEKHTQSKLSTGLRIFTHFLAILSFIGWILCCHKNNGIRTSFHD